MPAPKPIELQQYWEKFELELKKLDEEFQRAESQRQAAIAEAATMGAAGARKWPSTTQARSSSPAKERTSPAGSPVKPLSTSPSHEKHSPPKEPSKLASSHPEERKESKEDLEYKETREKLLQIAKGWIELASECSDAMKKHQAFQKKSPTKAAKPGEEPRSSLNISLEPISESSVEPEIFTAFMVDKYSTLKTLEAQLEAELRPEKLEKYHIKMAKLAFLYRKHLFRFAEVKSINDCLNSRLQKEKGEKRERLSAWDEAFTQYKDSQSSDIPPTPVPHPTKQLAQSPSLFQDDMSLRETVNISSDVKFLYEYREVAANLLKLFHEQGWAKKLLNGLNQYSKTKLKIDTSSATFLNSNHEKMPTSQAKIKRPNVARGQNLRIHVYEEIGSEPTGITDLHGNATKTHLDYVSQGKLQGLAIENQLQQLLIETFLMSSIEKVRVQKQIIKVQGDKLKLWQEREMRLQQFNAEKEQIYASSEKGSPTAPISPVELSTPLPGMVGLSISLPGVSSLPGISVAAPTLVSPFVAPSSEGSSVPASPLVRKVPEISLKESPPRTIAEISKEERKVREEMSHREKPLDLFSHKQSLEKLERMEEGFIPEARLLDEVNTIHGKIKIIQTIIALYKALFGHEQECYAFQLNINDENNEKGYLNVLEILRTELENAEEAFQGEPEFLQILKDVRHDVTQYQAKVEFLVSDYREIRVDHGSPLQAKFDPKLFLFTREGGTTQEKMDPSSGNGDGIGLEDHFALDRSAHDALTLDKATSADEEFQVPDSLVRRSHSSSPSPFREFTATPVKPGVSAAATPASKGSLLSPGTPHPSLMGSPASPSPEVGLKTPEKHSKSFAAAPSPSSSSRGSNTPSPAGKASGYLALSGVARSLGSLFSFSAQASSPAASTGPVTLPVALPVSSPAASPTPASKSASPISPEEASLTVKPVVSAVSHISSSSRAGGSTSALSAAAPLVSPQAQVRPPRPATAPTSLAQFKLEATRGGRGKVIDSAVGKGAPDLENYDDSDEDDFGDFADTLTDALDSSIIGGQSVIGDKPDKGKAAAAAKA